MTDHADNLEREETISDLDLPDGEADLVTGGFHYLKIGPALDLTVTKTIREKS